MKSESQLAGVAVYISLYRATSIEEGRLTSQRPGTPISIHSFLSTIACQDPRDVYGYVIYKNKVSMSTS